MWIRWRCAKPRINATPKPSPIGAWRPESPPFTTEYSRAVRRRSPQSVRAARRSIAASTLPKNYPSDQGDPRDDRLAATRAGNLLPRDLSLSRSEEHTSELQSHSDLVCRLLLEKK